MLACVLLFPGIVFAQGIGKPKVADGSMHEWSYLGWGGHGTVDNEWYFYDSGDTFWKDPQGGPDDEPLSILLLKDHPITGKPEPVASGFNLWGAYLCYEPHRDGVSVTVALDLPLSSNPGISPEYEHPYSGLPPLYELFYPVAFDADGNGDPNTVSDFYLKALIFDDRDEENYMITFYFGDDNFPTTAGPGGTNGLVIKVNMTCEFGIILPVEAILPGFQTKDGMDLDLIAAYGERVLEVGGHDNPNPWIRSLDKRIVDIEVKLNKLKAILEDPTYIDWSKVGIGKFPADDLRKIYISVKSGSLDDKSDEHLVHGGHVFPLPPFGTKLNK
jgi:hypothetical protein